MQQPTKTRFGGRFRLDLPVEFRLRGEGAFVEDVELIGVTLPPSPSSAAARDAFWKGHVAEVRQQDRRHQLAPIMNEHDLRPGIPGLVYRGYDENDLAHEALLTDQGRGVLVKALWRQGSEPADRPAENAERERAFNDVVKAFSFLPPDYAVGEPNAFHIKEGVVRLPYTASGREHQERFEIGLVGTTQRMTLTFEYVYLEPPPAGDRPGLGERVADGMGEYGVVGRSLRAGGRIVAGFSGEEAVIHATDDHKLSFLWMYEPDVDAIGFQPAITISAESHDGDVQSTIALWDQTVDGIHRMVP